MDNIKIIEIKKSVFADNDIEANELRNELQRKGVFLLNLMSSPGSGKTTTVKRILEEANKEYKTPVLVIESAKAEYRNMSLQPYVYTLGKPALNCIPMNPFYIQKGVNPQTHIDYLKDLFNASFSFYGPMPYILEKCLNNIP